MANPVLSGDLQINRVEVTQAVQDDQNAVPLVAGRTTVLRIFATTEDSPQEFTNVKVQVTASRDGAPISGSPTAFRSSIPLFNSRSDLNSTVNLKLPDAWLSGTIDLSISLDPENLIAEVDEGNNRLNLHLTFLQVPPLKIVIVPIRYTHTPTGVTYPAPTEDTISQWMLRIFPVNMINVSWHAPYSFTGNLRLSNDWNTLLYEVTSLKSSEGAPSSTVYYGFVPTSEGVSTWFTGGIAGIGWVGSRAAVGLKTSSSAPVIAAHEVGHNLGMWHAPCGTPTSVDPDYPYMSGSIGQYGLDVTNGVIYSPETGRDLMSYCNPRWISDYTYINLLQSQIRYGANQQSILSSPTPGGENFRSLLVRARVNAAGAELLPLYVLRARQNENPAAGEYQVHLIGEDGKILSVVPVQANNIDLDGEENIGLHAQVPLPAQPVARVRLVRNGLVLAERALREAGSFETHVETAVVGDGLVVRWNSGKGPALLRYISDDGESWTTLGVDLQGGEYSIDPVALPSANGRFEVIIADTWD